MPHREWSEFAEDLKLCLENVLIPDVYSKSRI